MKYITGMILALLAGNVNPADKPAKLIWSDEFNTDGAPDPAKWGYDIGTGNNGWGNAES